jgi:Leucine-rich repeat (LRR) protein
MQLDLRLSDLKEIPPSVFRTPGVTSLNLDMNHISEVPDEILEMQELEELFLGYNMLAEINPAIFQLPKLRKLRLSRNRLSGTLKSIEFGSGPSLEMDISHNQIEDLEGFVGCPRLCFLNVCYNRLKRLRGDLFDDSPHLEKLHIGNNELSLIPSGLFRHAAIQFLSVPYNILQEIQSSDAEVANLRVLHAQGNCLRSLPARMGALEELIAHENRFSSFPEFPSVDGRLRRIDLCYNQISDIPDWLHGHAALSWLVLSRNRIECLPDYLLLSPSLEYLSLADNPINQLPPISSFRSSVRFRNDKLKQRKLYLDLHGHGLPSDNELSAYSKYFDVVA